MAAQAQRDRAIPPVREEVQEVLVPAPGRVPRAVNKKQRYRMGCTRRPLLDHFKHKPPLRSIAASREPYSQAPTRSMGSIRSIGSARSSVSIRSATPLRSIVPPTAGSRLSPSPIILAGPGRRCRLARMVVDERRDPRGHVADDVFTDVHLGGLSANTPNRRDMVEAVGDVLACSIFRDDQTVPFAQQRDQQSGALIEPG